MDQTITTLQSLFEKTEALMGATPVEQLSLSTPCGDFDVEELLEHIAVWIQVFDSAVNDRPLGFDPSTHRVGEKHREVFAASARSIVEGLDERGADRMMTMTSDPIPGEFVLNMLLMEYIGHGWDLARTIGRPVPYSDVEATVALEAAQKIIEPQYRGTGMFDHEIDPGPNAPPMEEFVAFLGRNPSWGRA